MFWHQQLYLKSQLESISLFFKICPSLQCQGPFHPTSSSNPTLSLCGIYSLLLSSCFIQKLDDGVCAVSCGVMSVQQGSHHTSLGAPAHPGFIIPGSSWVHHPCPAVLLHGFLSLLDKTMESRYIPLTEIPPYADDGAVCPMDALPYHLIEVSFYLILLSSTYCISLQLGSGRAVKPSQDFCRWFDTVSPFVKLQFSRKLSQRNESALINVHSSGMSSSIPDRRHPFLILLGGCSRSVIVKVSCH